MYKKTEITVACRIPSIITMVASMINHGIINEYSYNFAFPRGEKLYLAKIGSRRMASVDDLIAKTIEFLNVHDLSAESVIQAKGKEFQVIGKGSVLWDITAAKGANINGRLSSWAELVD